MGVVIPEKLGQLEKHLDNCIRGLYRVVGGAENDSDFIVKSL
jgi:hypothetical protein